MEKPNIQKPILFFLCFFLALPLCAQEWETRDSVALSPTPYLEVKKVTIGVVQDGPSPLLDQLSQRTEKELKLLGRDEFEVVFKKIPAFQGNWTVSSIDRALKNALSDPEVDLVYAVGPLATRRGALPTLVLNKPLLGGLVLDADAIDLPYDKEAGRSTKNNFSFVVSPSQVSRDLATLTKISSLKKLHVFIDGNVYQGIKGPIEANLRRKEEEYQMELILIPMYAQAQKALNQLEGQIEFVYYTPGFSMTETEKQKLIDGVNARKIPSFSLSGIRDVQRGVLAGLKGDNLQRLSRRIALNIQQILLGTPSMQVPVYLPVEDQLVLNAKTASAIGYSPSFSLLAEAELLYGDQLEKGEVLTLDKTIEIASKNNIDLAVAKAEVDDARARKYQAFSPLLPQVDSKLDFLLIDKDRARATLSDEHATTTGFTASQIVFNDAVLSQFRASKRDYKGQVYEEATVRLDVIDIATKRFLDTLSFRALLQVEVDNLKLTQSNLELARTRVQVGTAGPEEVYRWEAQEANQKASVYQAESRMEQTRVALNQSLGLDQFKVWDLKEILLEDNDYYFLQNKISGAINNPRELAFFQHFIVEEALRNAPELKAVEKGIEAQTILLNQLKRRFVLPTASTFVDYDRLIKNKDNIPDDFLEPDRDDWTFGVSVVYPIFEGGKRVFDVRQAKAQLDQLKQTYERTQQLVEQRAQQSLFGLSGSHPNIRLSRQAAASADKNLRVVQRKYAEGIVPIIDLLDAQSDAFTQNQNAAIAVYAYLNDLIEFERSLAWFESTKSDEENNLWIERFQSYMGTMEN